MAELERQLHRSQAPDAKEWERLSSEQSELVKDAIEIIKTGKSRGNLYEQTFFTNRPKGDDSHLLKWYEPVSKEQIKWIAAEAENAGISGKTGLSGGDLYQAVKEALGSPQAASEFLYRAGIDGVR